MGPPEDPEDQCESMRNLYYPASSIELCITAKCHVDQLDAYEAYVNICFEGFWGGYLRVCGLFASTAPMLHSALVIIAIHTEEVGYYILL